MAGESKRPSDAELIQRALTGDQVAYGQLLDAYRRQVLALVWRMVSNREEAKDLAQEAFIRAFKSLHTFDTSRSFPAWLFRITTNLCVDYYRRKKLDTISMSVEGDSEREGRTIDLESPDIGPEEQLEGRESVERIEKMIKSLPAPYRIVILLRHQGDLSYDEIAEALNLPIGTVKARIHRAHKMLRDKLDRWG